LLSKQNLWFSGFLKAKCPSTIKSTDANLGNHRLELSRWVPPNERNVLHHFNMPVTRKRCKL